MGINRLQARELIAQGCTDILSLPEWKDSEDMQIYAVGINPAYIKLIPSPTPKVRNIVKTALEKTE